MKISRFMVSLPWSTVKSAPIRRGLVTLSEVMGDRGPRQRDIGLAYVVLRRILTMADYSLPSRNIELEITVNGFNALRAELPSVLNPELEEAYQTALDAEREKAQLEREERPLIPPSDTIRRRRSFNFGR